VRRRGIAILLVAGMGAFVWVLREGSFSRAQDCGPTTLSRDSSVFTPAHKRVAQSCAQQRITLRFVSGIIASRQFT